jgi:hypothetical protein
MGLEYVLLLLFIKNLQKLQKNSATTKEKNKNRFGILRISEILFNACLSTFENNRILHNNTSHQFFKKAKPFTGFGIPFCSR